MKYLLLTFVWAAWGVLHSLMISRSFTRWVENRLRENFRYYRLMFNTVAMATFATVLAYSETLDSRLIITYSHSWKIVQYVLITLALAIFIWSFKQFDFLRFLGIRQAMNKGVNPKATSQPVVVTSGPYRFTRHPMYLGAAIFIWSLDATLAGIVTNIVLTIYIIIGCLLEERKLAAEFGDSYIEYQKKVPMLFPWKGN